MNKHSFGLIKGKPDHRDFKLSRPTISPSDLPISVDLRPQMPPVYDQGQLGSCTANAIAGAVQYLCVKNAYKWAFTPSRLFIYYNERVVEGTVLQDAGADLRDGLKVLNSQGVCPEAMADGSNPGWLWPYSDGPVKFRLQPPSQCYRDALLHKAVKYESVPLDATTMQSLLVEGLPVIFGIQVYASFESDSANTTGVIPMPDVSSEELLGGHALLAVGYMPGSMIAGADATKNYFIFRNSWNTTWGAEGYGFIPFDYLTDSSLGSDYWCCELIG